MDFHLGSHRNNRYTVLRSSYFEHTVGSPVYNICASTYNKKDQSTATACRRSFYNFRRDVRILNTSSASSSSKEFDSVFRYLREKIMKRKIGKDGFDEFRSKAILATSNQITCTLCNSTPFKCDHPFSSLNNISSSLENPQFTKCCSDSDESDVGYLGDKTTKDCPTNSISGFLKVVIYILNSISESIMRLLLPSATDNSKKKISGIQAFEKVPTMLFVSEVTQSSYGQISMNCGQTSTPSIDNVPPQEHSRDECDNVFLQDKIYPQCAFPDKTQYECALPEYYYGFIELNTFNKLNTSFHQGAQPNVKKSAPLSIAKKLSKYNSHEYKRGSKNRLLSECESEDSYVIFSNDIPQTTPSSSFSSNSSPQTSICSKLNIINRARQRQLSEGSEDGIYFEHSDGSPCDDDISESSYISDTDDSDESSDETDVVIKPDTYQIDSGLEEKKVRFNFNPEVHVMRAWDYAYRQARIGKWEEAARDRDRFRCRIENIGKILTPIMDTKTRDKIYNERFIDYW